MLAEVRRKQRTLGLKKDQRVPSVCARTHFHHSLWPRGGWRHFNDEAKPSRRTNTSSFLFSLPPSLHTSDAQDGSRRRRCINSEKKQNLLMEFGMKMRECRKQGYVRSLEGKKGTSNEEAKRKKKNEKKENEYRLRSKHCMQSRRGTRGRWILGEHAYALSVWMFCTLPARLYKNSWSGASILKTNTGWRHIAQESLQKAVYTYI